MSAHSDKADTISETPDDTESSPPLPDDIVCEGDKIDAEPFDMSSPDDTDEEWDPPMSDATLFEAKMFQAETSRTLFFDDTDVDWDRSSPDDIVIGKFEDMLSWGDRYIKEERFDDAVRVYERAKRTEEENQLAHYKLSVIHLRRGVVDIANMHLTKASPECKENLCASIEKVKDHLIQGAQARKDENWIAALKEVDFAIAEGANCCQPILAFRAEMLLRMDRVDQAEETITRAMALESNLKMLTKFLGMPPEAYSWAVKAQIEMALGRFENAVAAADRAHRIDEFNDEISAILTRTARITGNKHYRSGDYLKACEEYKVGLAYAKSNVSLLNNLAACHWKLETWENCIEICNEVLKIKPDNVKALVRRAESYAKLEKWPDSVKDYAAAMKIYPGDKNIAKGLKESQAARKKSLVTKLAEMLLEAEGAVKESQVEEVSED